MEILWSDKPAYIQFGEEEYEKVQKASQKTSVVLSVNQFVRTIVHEELEKIDKDDFHLEANKCNTLDNVRYKVVRFQIPKKDYQKIEHIINMIPIGMSRFLKYLIMPEIEKRLQEKERI